MWVFVMGSVGTGMGKRVSDRQSMTGGWLVSPYHDSVTKKINLIKNGNIWAQELLIIVLSYGKTDNVLRLWPSV
jgi:hypothetical protein